MKDKIAGKDPCYIINMDQSHIPYSFHSSKMLETKGMRMIHICASAADTKQVTHAVTLDANRKMLPSMLIFKGVPNGNDRKFVTYLDHGHYACQKKAWIDEEMMNKWIDLILIP